MVNLTVFRTETANQGNLALADPARAYGVQDCCFLALITTLSSLFYISRLGFYWDDWQVLKIFRFSADQSVIGLTRSVFIAWPEMLVRPIQAFQWAALYPLFGVKPLGYHLVSTVTLFAGLCAFYFVLRSLTGRRLVSLASAILYGLLPHYSTDRFWYAIWAANLSMLFYFLSLYGDLRQLSVGKSWIGPWKIMASVTLIISSLAYELFMPFFLLNPVLIALKRRQLRSVGKKVGWGWTGSGLFYLANPVLLVLISMFKQRTSRRAPGAGQYGWWLVDNAWTSSVDLTFRSYGFNMPHILSAVWTKYWNWTSSLIALAVVIAVAWYLVRAAKISGELLPRTAVLALLVVAGMLLSGMSYSYLYSFYEVNTGVNNRVAIAAAATVAIAWVSLSALVSRALFREPAATYVFSVTIAVLCGYGCLLNNTISSFWIAASQKQTEVLSDMKQHFAAPRNSSVLVTGLCAWTGPGIIFEATWDVEGALAVLYGDDTIKGEPVWPWLTVTEQGIPSGPNTSGKSKIYPFDSLYLYDVRKKQALKISDPKAASDFIARSAEYNVNNKGCLTAGFGTGLPIW